MISNNLIVVGHPIPDHNLVFYALQGLKFTLRSIPIYFDELYSHLLAHE